MLRWICLFSLKEITPLSLWKDGPNAAKHAEDFLPQYPADNIRSKTLPLSWQVEGDGWGDSFL